MYIDFKSLQWKNLLSYGNNLNEISFNTGMTLITAQNGGGKSSVIDALSFCLFGQPYRDIKIPELINRKNKKKLWTRCEFKIDSDTYTITRTLSPSSIEIVKNGSDIELLSSKRLNQEEIDKILGINYNVFKQVVCLAINNNSSFLSQSAQQKRNIIESIFDIKIFGEMLSKLKSKNKLLKMESQVSTRTLEIQEASLKSLMKQIKNIIETKETFDTDKQNDIDRIEESIANERLEIEKTSALITEKKEELEELLKSITEEDLQKKLQKINEEIAVNKAAIKENKSRALLIANNDVCPTCSAQMTEEHRLSELQSLQEDTSRKLYNVKQLEDSRRIAQDEIDAYTRLKSTSRDIQNDIRHLTSKQSTQESNLTRMILDLERVEARTFSFDIDVLEAECEEKKVEYTKQFKKNSEITEEIRYNDFASTLLSDQGIKTYFFKRLVPVLNSKINEYLDRFDLPVSLAFNEEMEESINILNSPEKDVSYMSFSEGEKKRIDISLMLSFIDTMKVISNWNSNILVFDEILDTSTDSQGLDKIMGAVKQMTIDNNRLCTYIISHRESDHSNYTGRINVKKSGGFSSIEQE